MTRMGGLVLQTFNVVRQYIWILQIIFHLHTFNKIHTTFRMIEDKYFVFGLPQESAAMDVLEVRMIFEHHDNIHRTHFTTNKAFWAWYKITTNWRCNSTKYIHDNLWGWIMTNQFHTLEESLSITTGIATWPLRLMLGKCIKKSLWLSTRRFWIMTN